MSETPLPPLFMMEQLLQTLETDATARYEARRAGTPLGPVTGFPKLDEAMGSALSPGLHIVHGSPGSGKTAFALQIASSCACPALFVTTEMTGLELFRRHIARITDTYLGTLKDGSRSPREVRRLGERAAAAAPQLALMDATEVIAPPAHILEVANLLRRKSETGYLLVVVDSLHTWADGACEGEEYDRLNNGLTALRGISKRLDCPLLAIAERNRGSMKNGGQSAGAGSRKIEYGSESVLELDAIGDGTDGNKDVTLKISKNRNGTAGQKIDLIFEGGFQSFREARG